MKLSLSVNQLKIVMRNVAPLSPANQDRFLDALALHLADIRYPTDSELALATQRALENIACQEQKKFLDEINLATYRDRQA